MKTEENKTTQDFLAPDVGTSLKELIRFRLELTLLMTERNTEVSSKEILARIFEEEVTTIIMRKLSVEDFQMAFEKATTRFDNYQECLLDE